MKINEYIKVKDYTYLEYCDYLQNKYGIGRCDYMTPNWSQKPKCKRTDEGLIAHHKCEDRAILLSTKEYAQQNPFEYQKAENIVYCDYLEHLYLHILICEYPNPDTPDVAVGIGGVVDFLIPELNDFYSGYRPKKEWKQNCLNLVINDVDVYYQLVSRFKSLFQICPPEFLLTSFYDGRGWQESKNIPLYKTLIKL